MRSLVLDWGVCPKLTLKIGTDSSAAKGFATRRGLGRQRHVSTRFLWLQDKVSKGDLKVVKLARQTNWLTFDQAGNCQMASGKISRVWFGVSWWPFFYAAWTGNLMVRLWLLQLVRVREESTWRHFSSLCCGRMQLWLCWNVGTKLEQTTTRGWLSLAVYTPVSSTLP